jgi:tRNA-dihydrouridine synthase B
MRIGNVILDNNLVMAPMAGITDMAFRTICKEFGAGLVCTEMVSAKGLYYEDKKTELLMEINPSNRPVSLQIFGSDPGIIEAVILEKLNRLETFDILDINMGCPAPKIVNNGDGSALMKKPLLAREIMSRAKKASNKPVTVKIRKGWNIENINYMKIGAIAEECGIDALILHGRTRSQFYAEKADWDTIKEIKDKLSIKLIGNGDLYTVKDVERMIEDTGCDGVMIGRGALGRPWIFRDILNYLKYAEIPKEPKDQDKFSLIIKHLNLMMTQKPEKISVLQMRKHCSWYIKGMHGAAEMRNRFNTVNTKLEMEELINEYAIDLKNQ